MLFYTEDLIYSPTHCRIYSLDCFLNYTGGKSVGTFHHMHHKICPPPCYQIDIPDTSFFIVIVRNIILVRGFEVNFNI